MSLSGQQRKRLQEALIDAFPMKSSLEQMLSFELDKNLDRIVGDGSLETVVFNLIKLADSQGWVEDLVLAARKLNDGNRSLKAIAQEILTPSLSTPSTPSTESLTNPIPRSREIGNRIKNKKIIIATLIIILGLSTSVGISHIIPMLGAATVELLSKKPPNETQAKYAQLQYFLEAKNWQEADLQTTQLMLNIAKREKQGYLDHDDINSFSCPDLRNIDKLWVDNSNGRFGFSVQKEIWIKTKNRLAIKYDQWNDTDHENYKRFRSAVGWYDDDTRVNVSYNELLSRIKSNPYRYRGSLPSNVRDDTHEGLDRLFLELQLVKCNI